MSYFDTVLFAFILISQNSCFRFNFCTLYEKSWAYVKIIFAIIMRQLHRFSSFVVIMPLLYGR